MKCHIKTKLLCLSVLSLSLFGCFYACSSSVSAVTVNTTPSYIWATYRNLQNSSDTFVDKQMCSGSQCTNPFAMLGNSYYNVYGLVVDTPVNFTTLSYGSAKYEMYIWTSGRNMTGDGAYTTEELSSTISGTLRDGSVVTTEGSCSRSWYSDEHQIKLECVYPNLRANTNYTITTVRFGESNLNGTPIFVNRPGSGGIIYTSDYAFTYSTSDSAEVAQLYTLNNTMTQVLNQTVQQGVNITDAVNVGSQHIEDATNHPDWVIEEREELDEQAQDTEDTANAESEQAQNTATSLLDVIVQVLAVFTNAQPTNCNLNGDLIPHLPLGNLNLCEHSPPPAITALGSILLISFVVPLAYHLVKRMLALIGSFQS